MQIGMIGLGRMGANMVRRLMRGGHECVVYDVNSANVQALVGEGAIGAQSLQDMVSKLAKPAAIWLMLPAAITEKTIVDLSNVLVTGDAIIDGGNSNYQDDIDRAGRLAEKGLDYIDVGTSGGVWGLDRGYCLMIGGPNEAVTRLDPIFRSLAPGAGMEVASGRTSELGYLHCGPSGSGHFVKMVHNGIEYGMMAAYAEGMNLMKAANAGQQNRAVDAETSPLQHPQYYQFDIDVTEVAEVWRHGSVVSSWLLDLLAQSLKNDPTLESFSGRVSDSGEGRWMLKAGIDTGVPLPILSSALFQRFTSQGHEQYSNQVLSALRAAFGGHAEKPHGSDH
ncbi:decarboxylating 6-phosphogluconate dehydrogenase [Neorhizobium lilium]|uniref:Decarboxylating 6-phosphogluconate dehydrogenase n=1 Tax=Neorhizobium lilium TaxID=2503024 RepID=A0A444LN97_9HYPH|nr:decarboxylating 6-phosphogluconate dehydrogenase [Neorhizobium lilium]RWX81805.1 decarboxylating 6-phosphogluconate dehydrogenase [Neorhizobium lilium]